MSTPVYNIFISSHGKFPSKKEISNQTDILMDDYKFKLPKNVELSFLTPLGHYGYCDNNKDKKIIDTLNQPQFFDEITEDKIVLKNESLCPNMVLQFESKKNTLWGGYVVKADGVDTPRMVVGYEKSLPLYGDFNNDENIPDFFNMGQRKQSLQLILDVILQQIMKKEKNDFTAKVVLNCCLNYPTRYEHGYSGKEIVAITKFLQKSINICLLKNIINHSLVIYRNLLETLIAK